MRHNNWLSGLRGTANSRFPFPFSPQQSVVNKIPPLESHPWIKFLYRRSPNKKKDVFYLGGHNIVTFVYLTVSRVLWNRIQFGGRRNGKGGPGAREIVPGKMLVGGRTGMRALGKEEQPVKAQIFLFKTLPTWSSPKHKESDRGQSTLPHNNLHAVGVLLP